VNTVAPERVLPLRVPIAASESLDSWLEALARRNGLAIGTLLPVLGWPGPYTPARLMLNTRPPARRRLEQAGGLPPGRLDDAVLDQYRRLGPVSRGGCRYCPRCLTGSHGRWLLAWRLPWVFACTDHHLLLHDTCPACRQPPRRTVSTAGLNHPAACPTRTAPGIYCGADLREAATQPLAPGGRLLAAQQWINTLLTAGRQPGTAPAAAAATVFTDLSVVAGWLLHQPTAGPATGIDRQIQPAWPTQPADGHHVSGRLPPQDAALTGALAAAAMPLVGGGDTQAIDQIRILLSHQPAGQRSRPAGLSDRNWKRLSRPVQSRFLRALDEHLAPRQRIGHRTGTPLAAVPDPASGGLLAARARRIPQLLWPEWAIRLLPAEGFLPGPFRSVISACLMLPGNPDASIRRLIAGLHPYRSTIAVNTVLRTLAANGHGSVFAAICHLANYLDTNGGPIDYHRRRTAITPDILTWEQWQSLCYQAAAHPGESRRLLDGQRYLSQLLTGNDLSDPHHRQAFRSAADRANHLAFTDTLTSALRQALHDHAAGHLHRLGIDEPLTWQPPANCCAHLALPGRDPDDIDLNAVHRLLVVEGVPPGAAAERLNTTVGHVRLALERVHRPPRTWGSNAAPAAWQRRQRADLILTRAFFEREYIHAGKRLDQLQTETGFGRALIADYARKHRIPLAYAHTSAAIDKDWLREQYLHRQRSFTDIAAELGVLDVTVIAAARRHGIPSRPPGVHSRPEMLTTLDPDIPADIRRAVEGGLKGWHRLHRFQTAMAFPTIEAAAAHLDAHQSVLVNQFQRLERDIGAKLFHRSTPRRPMRPTGRGTALLDALARTDVRAIARNRT
jgi:hypothetical protein